MPYSINGTDLTMQPTEGRWVDRDALGRDGNGRNIYPAPREFEMKFNLISTSDLQQLQTFFSAVGATGTVVVSLPQYGASAYQFYSYSGCILSEPTVNAYFEEYLNDVKITVSKITT